MINCYAGGVLPRPQGLISTTRAYDRGGITDTEMDKVFRTTTQAVIDTQLAIGLNYVNDGMLRWQDLLRPFTKGLEGIEIGGLARWFNNNTFYRTPVVTGPIQARGSMTRVLTYLELLPKKKPWKAVLPAPYTFVILSEDRYYKDKTELLFTFSKALNNEIKELEKVGFNYIQLSDPALTYISTKPELKTLSSISEALKIVAAGVEARICLQTFFGDISKILPFALDFPVNDLGIDLYETNIDVLKEYNFRGGISLGLVDARNSLLEDPDELIFVTKGILEALQPERIYISTNCDLDFLTWNNAKKKMKLLVHVTEQLRREYDD